MKDKKTTELLSALAKLEPLELAKAQVTVERHRVKGLAKSGKPHAWGVRNSAEPLITRR